ncbi:MAG: hypothetical protein OHK0038_00240 [Flammeovirgaceae bacterium]
MIVCILPILEVINSSGTVVQSNTNTTGAFILRGDVYEIDNYTIRVRSSNNCATTNWVTASLKVVPTTDPACNNVNPMFVNNFVVFPNPASEVLNIGYENEEETLKLLNGNEAKFSVRMYNLMQEVVAEGESKNGKAITLNVSSLASGVYALLITRADKAEQITVMVE